MYMHRDVRRQTDCGEVPGTPYTNTPYPLIIRHLPIRQLRPTPTFVGATVQNQANPRHCLLNLQSCCDPRGTNDSLSRSTEPCWFGRGSEVRMERYCSVLFPVKLDRVARCSAIEKKTLCRAEYEQLSFIVLVCTSAATYRVEDCRSIL